MAPITASDPDVFKNYTPLENDNVQLDLKQTSRMMTLWPMRMSNKMINKVRSLDSEKQGQILQSIFTLQMGLISDAQILETGPIMYLAGFSKMIKYNQTLVFAVVPERVPVVQTILNKTHIAGFRFRQYLRIIDIVPTGDKQQAYQSYQTFASYLQDDPDKWNPFLPGNFLETQGSRVKADNNFELMDIKNIVSIKRDSMSDQLLYLPNLDSTYKLSTIELRSFTIIAMRWVSELESSKLAFKIVPQFVSSSLVS